jgi:hypothetical protein
MSRPPNLSPGEPQACAARKTAEAREEPTKAFNVLNAAATARLPTGVQSAPNRCDDPGSALTAIVGVLPVAWGSDSTSRRARSCAI